MSSWSQNSILDLRRLIKEQDAKLTMMRADYIELESRGVWTPQLTLVKNAYFQAGHELQEMQKSLEAMTERKEMQHPEHITKQLVDRAAAKRLRKAQRNLSRSGQ